MAVRPRPAPGAVVPGAGLGDCQVHVACSAYGNQERPWGRGPLRPTWRSQPQRVISTESRRQTAGPAKPTITAGTSRYGTTRNKSPEAGSTCRIGSGISPFHCFRLENGAISLSCPPSLPEAYQRPPLGQLARIIQHNLLPLRRHQIQRKLLLNMTTTWRYSSHFTFRKVATL